MKIFTLFETDVHKSRESRVFLGNFSTEIEAIDAFKENDHFSDQTELVILESELDEYGEQ